MGAAADYSEAVELFRVADDDTNRVAKTLNALGTVAMSQGAYALVSETLSLPRAWDERTELADTLEILATMAAQEGEAERVVRLLAGAAAIRSAAGAPLGDHQRAQLARALGPASAAVGRDVFGWPPTSSPGAGP